MTTDQGLGHLTIRRADPADIEDIHALVELCYRGPLRDRAWTTEVSLVAGDRSSVDEIRSVVTGPDSFMLVADRCGAVIACCQVERRDHDKAYFGMFAVDPGSQNLGIGRMLLRAAEREAIAAFGATRMVMLVIDRRAELLEWYGRLGYETTGEIVPFASHAPAVSLEPDLAFTVLARNLISPA